MTVAECGCRNCQSKPSKPWISAHDMAQWNALRWTYERDVAAGLEGESSVEPGSRMFPGLTPVGLCTDPRHAGLPRHMAGQHA